MQEFAELSNKLQSYFNGKNVDKAILFGSYARGTATRKSDIDIIIITKTSKRFFKRYEDFEDLYSIVGSSLDMLIYSNEEWENIKGRHFFRRVLSEGKTIYVK
jgi:predicted nucleotidyltransferase